MIVVKVELWSAITHQKTEIARMTICNVGGTTTRGNYSVATMRGRDAKTLHNAMLDRTHTHEGQVTNHPRWKEHVWNLVAKGLLSMGYGVLK
jgi:uncharacterized protein YjcR